MKQTNKPLNSPKPEWLKRRLPRGPEFEKMRRLLAKSCLNTVCDQANCPNQWECFSNNTATFLLLGDKCTRNCRFCSVPHEQCPSPPDHSEPEKVKTAVKQLGLQHIVITSVTRDDLDDGGASLFAETIHALKSLTPKITVEVLIPDLKGSTSALKKIINAQPDVIGHNIETVPRLYPTVRPQASYQLSLGIFSKTKEYSDTIVTKSGLMLGLGEHEEEIKMVLLDLLSSGCDLITIGQYLQPSPNHLPVSRYLPPEEFDSWRKKAIELGFKNAACGPFVRSSYKAAKMISR